MVVNQVSANLNVTSSQKFSEFKQPEYGYFIQSEKIEQKPKNKKKKLWLKIGIGLVGGLIAIIGTYKIMPKSAFKKFDKFKRMLEKKIEQESTTSKTAIFYRKILKASQSFGEKCQGFNNLMSFKDVWIQRQITDRIPLLKKMCHTTTKWFNNIGKSTVKMYYKSSSKNFKSLDETFVALEKELLLKNKTDLVPIDGITKTKEEWVKILTQKRAALDVKMEANFSMASVEARRPELQKIVSDLEAQVWGASFANKANFRNKDTYFTFIADKFIAVDRAKMVQNVRNLRNEISYNLSDRVKALRDMLLSNRKVLNPQDVVSEKLFRELSKQLSSLELCEKGTPQYKTLEKEILVNIKAFQKSVHGSNVTYKYDDQILNAVDEHSRIMEEIIQNTKKGTIEEMLTIYKQLLPEKEYRQLKKQILGTIKSLDKSINKECVEYLNKLRDLRLGSAPTDVMSILIGFGTLGVALAYADDKEARNSITLKYGIPAIGGMATTMVITSMLVSGLKAPIIGFVFSLILNRFGVMAENKYKKYNSGTPVA